jgi:hypothetical protein
MANTQRCKPAECCETLPPSWTLLRKPCRSSSAPLFIMALLASAPTSRSTSHRAPSVSPRPCASLRPAVHKCLSREAAWAAASARLGAAAASARLGACSSQSESLAQLPVPPGSVGGVHWHVTSSQVGVALATVIGSLASPGPGQPGGGFPPTRARPELLALPAGRRRGAPPHARIDSQVTSRHFGATTALGRYRTSTGTYEQASYDTASGARHVQADMHVPLARGRGRRAGPVVNTEDGECHGCKGA